MKSGHISIPSACLLGSKNATLVTTPVNVLSTLFWALLQNSPKSQSTNQHKGHFGVQRISWVK